MSGGFEDFITGFKDRVGPSLSFGDGDRNTLLGFLEDRGPSLAEAQSVTQRQFTGPSEVESDQVATFDNRAKRIADLAKSLQRGQGVQAHLQQRAPGLSTGEARLDASRLGSDFFRGQAKRSDEAESLSKTIQAQTKEANDLASSRSQEAADTRRESTEFVEKQQADTLKAIDNRVRELQQSELDLAGDVGRFREDPTALSDNEIIRGIQDRIASDPGFQTRQQAEQASQALASKYDEVFADGIGLAEMSTTGRGEPALVFKVDGVEIRLDPLLRDRPVFANRRGQKVKPPAKFLRHLDAIIAREKEYQDFRLGGRFAAFNAIPGVTGSLDNTAQGFRDPTRFNFDIQGAELPDQRNAVSFQEGDTATRGNVATSAEAVKVNRASDLLENVVTLARTDPRQAGQIMDQSEALIREQERELQRRRGRLTDAEKEWEAEVRRARQLYRDAKKDHLIGDIIRGASWLPLAAPAAVALSSTLD